MSRRKELLKNKITDNEKRRNKLNIFIHKDILTQKVIAQATIL